MGYLDRHFAVEEERLTIGGIPCIRLIPKGLETSYRTIIFYHGLDSSKDRQRIRGHILAGFGYQVLLPDAVHHGERDRKETEDPEKIGRYFWQAILTSLRESDSLVDKILGDLNSNGEIYVTGHSMGGFTAAGVATHNDRIRGAIPMNGSFNWKRSSQILMEDMGLTADYDFPEREEMEALDPIKHIERLEGKRILMLNGEIDQEVSILPQKEFYNIARHVLDSRLDFIEYEGLGHFVTTNMLEDLLNYLEAGEVVDHD